jgi:hypothetical protein
MMFWGMDTDGVGTDLKLLADLVCAPAACTQRENLPFSWAEPEWDLLLLGHP